MTDKLEPVHLTADGTEGSAIVIALLRREIDYSFLTIEQMIEALSSISLEYSARVQNDLIAGFLSKVVEPAGSFVFSLGGSAGYSIYVSKHAKISFGIYRGEEIVFNSDTDALAGGNAQEVKAVLAAWAEWELKPERAVLKDSDDNRTYAAKVIEQMRSVGSFSPLLLYRLKSYFAIHRWLGRKDDTDDVSCKNWEQLYKRNLADWTRLSRIVFPS